MISLTPSLTPFPSPLTQLFIFILCIFFFPSHSLSVTFFSLPFSDSLHASFPLSLSPSPSLSLLYRHLSSFVNSTVPPFSILLYYISIYLSCNYFFLSFYISHDAPLSFPSPPLSVCASNGAYLSIYFSHSFCLHISPFVQPMVPLSVSNSLNLYLSLLLYIPRCLLSLSISVFLNLCIPRRPFLSFSITLFFFLSLLLSLYLSFCIAHGTPVPSVSIYLFLYFSVSLSLYTYLKIDFSLYPSHILFIVFSFIIIISCKLQTPLPFIELVLLSLFLSLYARSLPLFLIWHNFCLHSSTFNSLIKSSDLAINSLYIKISVLLFAGRLGICIIKSTLYLHLRERESVCVVCLSPLFTHGHLAYIIYTCFS